jgi:hypothetical protein
MPRPDAKFASIVLVGSFNPSIFHPQWCAAHEIISQTEADDSAKVTCTPQLTSFSLTWADIQVTQRQFVIKSKNPTLFTMLHDFVLKSFNLLTHTPVAAMGINVEQIFISSNSDAHKAFGDRIAPKAKWDFMKVPGLRDIVMEDQQRPDDYHGYIQARIQALRDRKNGILVSINDHYFIPDYETHMGCESVIDILQKNWKESIDRSDSWINTIIMNFS